MNTPERGEDHRAAHRPLPARRSAAGAHDARRRPAADRRPAPGAERGRHAACVAAAEVLPGSSPLWNLIRDNKTFQIPELQQRGKALGIIRLDDSLAELVRAGQDDARRSRKRFAESAGRARRRGRRRSARPRRPPPGSPPKQRADAARQARRALRKEGELAWPRIDALFDELLDAEGQRSAPRRRLPAAGARPRRARPARATRRSPGARWRRCSSRSSTPSRRRQIAEELDLDFAYAYGDKARFRANYFYKTTGLGAVFRTIPTKVLTLDELDMPEAVRKLAERRSGLGARHRPDRLRQVAPRWRR